MDSSFYDLKEALPKAEYMAEKSNKENKNLEDSYYSQLGLTIVKMIGNTSKSGERSVNVCLAEDNTMENCMKISIKDLKKAYKCYSKQAIGHCDNYLKYRYKNNKYYDKLNYQERAIYRVLMDLIDKNYTVDLFCTTTSSGDDTYFSSYYKVPYVTIVW